MAELLVFAHTPLLALSDLQRNTTAVTHHCSLLGRTLSQGFPFLKATLYFL